ncbi:MAG TPA: aldehyde dehydrogenase (NADP(+)) [Chitinophagaceae bacterium]|nr:aldehyde dehydrogenase (NADP(+)) [Chitinophagaceae bacterium]
MSTPDAQADDIHIAMSKSWSAFMRYRQSSLRERHALLYEIAAQVEALHDVLIDIAASETHLPHSRLVAEKNRMLFQLRFYADVAQDGSFLDLRIDHAQTHKNPTQPDIRKMNIPLGPVVIFGASNFPFAYSTAGGDTASALMAGCTVVVKAHPAHPKTCQLLADAIQLAVAKTGFPDGVFQQLFGNAHSVGETLVKHPLCKAVGFTGSYTGGKQLFDWANQRPEPIPVFAEMGSVNPVFLFPSKAKQAARQMADMLADSIQLGVGQFCTSPGIIIGIKNDDLDVFREQLAQCASASNPAPMLHEGIYRNFIQNRSEALHQPGVRLLNDMPTNIPEGYASASIACTDARYFLTNPNLHEEVFGPFALLVECRDMEEMLDVARSLKGQLTCSILAEDSELDAYRDLLDEISLHCGRLIINGVPTGVSVCHAMHHGGPYPATTDSRFTAVGPDAIKRFTRPLCFQNWPEHLLPGALQNSNPMNYRRMVKGNWTNPNADA